MAALLSTALVASVAGTSFATSFKTVVLSRQVVHIAGKKIRFATFEAAAINDKQQVAFYAAIYGGGVNPTNNTAIFAKYGSNINQIARNNVPITVNGVSTTYPTLTTNFLINRSGIVFWAADDSSGVTSYNLGYRKVNPISLGTVTNPAGATEPIADFNNRNHISLIGDRTDISPGPLTVVQVGPSDGIYLASVGDNAVGLPLGSTYTNFGNPTIDGSNKVYYTASVDGKGSIFDGIWAGKGKDPAPLVTIGQFASGSGESFTGFEESPHPSQNGKYCGFLADTATQSGIWIATTASGSLRNVALAGATVTTDNGTLTFKKLQPPAINNTGHAAFLATATTDSTTADDGTVTPGVTRLGLFYATASGQVRSVVRVGDVVQIGTQKLTVSNVRFKPRGGLTNNNKLLVTLSFSNRTTGIFIATP